MLHGYTNLSKKMNLQKESKQRRKTQATEKGAIQNRQGLRKTNKKQQEPARERALISASLVTQLGLGGIPG